MHGLPDSNTKYPRGQLALALAKSGFRIFPLKPGQKTPAIARWPDAATTDSAAIVDWWNKRDYNIGIACGPTPRITNGSGTAGTEYSLVVVDYDCKPGQQGAAALRRHTMLGYCDTLTSQTPNGIHKFYWATEPIPNSQGRLAPNVDVRGVRGYVVAPGSTVEGITYTWIGTETEPATFPQEFEVLARKGTAPDQTQAKAPIGELDRPEAVRWATSYLINEAPEARQGHHGDGTTFAVAARVKDFGISEQICLELLLSHYNEEKASPPWAFDALRTKVHNAYRYGENPPGSASPRNEFGPFVDGPQPEPLAPAPDQPAAESDAGTGLDRVGREPMLIESFATAAAGARDGRTKPLIEGLLGQGELSVLYGPPGSGKTFAALDLAYAIATGAPWNGMKTTQGAVLYVAAEGGPAVRGRFLALQAKYGVESAPLELLRYPIDMRTGTFDIKRLITLIQAREQQSAKVALVVIDTLSVALAGGNDTEHMQPYLYNAKLLQNATGAHVMSVHHPGKDPGKGLRGHSVLRDMMDTIIEVYAPSGARRGASRQLTVHKQRDEAVLEQALRFKLEILELGQTVDGFKLSSCVVQWDYDADTAEMTVEQKTEELKTEMTGGQKELFEAIERCATATRTDTIFMTADPLIRWLQANEPNHKLANMNKISTVRSGLKRLRDGGFLARVKC